MEWPYWKVSEKVYVIFYEKSLKIIHRSEKHSKEQSQVKTGVRIQASEKDLIKKISVLKQYGKKVVSEMELTNVSFEQGLKIRQWTGHFNDL